MTYFPACVGCAAERKTCPTLNKLKAGLKGHGVSLARHKCAAYTPALRPGMAVTVKTCQTIVAILDGACGGSMPGQKIACKHANVKPFLGGATYLVGDEFVTPGQEDSLGPWTGGTNWP